MFNRVELLAGQAQLRSRVSSIISAASFSENRTIRNDFGGLPAQDPDRKRRRAGDRFAGDEVPLDHPLNV
jgi:hypothetical protein